MIIIDTTIWVDYLRGVATPHTDWLESRVEQERLGLTDLILCEVLQGVRQDGDFQAVRRALLSFAVSPTGGIELAIAAARHYRLLRGEGYTIRRTIVCLIATYCLQHGHGLLHNNRDFDSFEQVFQLLVIHP